MDANQHWLGSSSSGAANGRMSATYYKPPPTMMKTSAEIISEARAAITKEPEAKFKSSKMPTTIRPVNTKRPFTPKERQRTLFGASRSSNHRPPSNFSLGYLNNQEDPATPPSPTIRRLHPLPHPSTHAAKYHRWNTLFEDEAFEEYFSETRPQKKPRSQSASESMEDVTVRCTESATTRLKLPSINRRHFRVSASLDNLPEDIESEEEVVDPRQMSRLSRSSPVQRTRSIESDLTQLTGSDTLAVTNEQETVSAHSTEIVQPKNESNPSNHRSKKVKGKLKHLDRMMDDTITTMDDDEKTVNFFDVEKWQLDVANPKEGHIDSVSQLKVSQDERTSVVNDTQQEFQNAINNDTEYTTENRLNKYSLTKPSKNLNCDVVNILDSEITDKEVNFFGSKVDNTIDSDDMNVSKLTADVLKFKYKSITSRTSDRVVPHDIDSIMGPKTNELISFDDEAIDYKVSNLTVLTPENNESVQSLLTTLNILAEKDGNDLEVIKNVHKLYDALIMEKAIGSNVRSNKIKSQVLKCLYKFVERTDDYLLIEIARIILSFRVRASNLSGVCKLVFKVSRNDKNDHLFMKNNVLELFLESFGCASPLEDAEACVYGYGALKFLTMNNIILNRVLHIGTLELMVLHMKIVNAARSEGTSIPEQTSHALFQLTGALRNVAGEEEMIPRFVTSGAVDQLCRAMELFSSDLDVISNVSRTLSIISTNDECCATIVSYANIFRVFVKLFEKYPGRQDIIVRLGYALGNLMARSDIARTKFYNEQGALESLINLLRIYLDKDLKRLVDLDRPPGIADSDSGSNGSIEDVIVKIIRIVANMSINPMVGSTLSGSSEAAECDSKCDADPVEQSTIIKINNKNGGRFLDMLLTVLRRKSVSESAELIHSVLSTLNNLSYYQPSEGGAFGQRQLEIAQALAALLNEEDKDSIVEATRVFGNLSRSKDTRDFIVESGGFRRLVEFLARDDSELLSTTVGILVNMMSDRDKRPALRDLGGVHRLILVLRKCSETDWELANLVCQALWNYSIETSNVYDAFGEDDTNLLLGLLIDALDEERLFGIEEGTEVPDTIASSEVYQLWDEFAGVATNLMEKIETYLDSLDRLGTN